MAGIPGLYFVIAAHDQARFVRPDPDNGLHTVGTVDFTALGNRNVAPAGPLDPPVEVVTETHDDPLLPY